MDLATALLPAEGRGGHGMSIFAETWAYLTDPANWQGPGGMWQLLIEQLLLSITALVAASVIGLPIALWLGHLGRGGFLAINVSNIGRAVPTFALLAILVTADWPGTAPFGPYGRAGLATLIALTLFALPPIITNAYVAVREVPADVREAADGMGMTGGQKFFRVELPLAAAAGHVRGPARPRAGVGDRHDRGARGGSGPGPDHHRRLLPHQLRQGHRRRGGRRRGRAASWS